MNNNLENFISVEELEKIKSLPPITEKQQNLIDQIAHIMLQEIKGQEYE